MRALADNLDDILPQTQCRKCGFEGCRPYAEAMASGRADLNRCPPGGAQGIARLAALLGVAPRPLDPACGAEAPPRLALIDESACIGCTLCIQACPVDAIVGAPKRMHSVLLEACTGCELCAPPCPVDCIDFIDRDLLASQGVEGARTRQRMDPAVARAQGRDRFQTHLRQRARLNRRNEARLARKAQEKLAALQGEDEHSQRKRATVLRALEKARSRRATPS